MKQEIMGMSDHQESLFAAVSDQIVNLVSEIQRLSPLYSASPTTCSAPNALANLSSEYLLHLYFLYLARPEKFSQDSDECRAFLMQCELHFQLQATIHPTDQSKIAYIIPHLTGHVEAWATAEWSHRFPVCSPYQKFTQILFQIS